MKRLSFTVVAFVLMLAAVELLARVAGTVKRDIDPKRSNGPEQWLVHSPTMGWEKKPDYEGSLGMADREFDAEGYLTVDSDEVHGKSGNKKVVFIGDSNTFGWGASTPDSFVEVTENLFPGVDAINLGVVGPRPALSLAGPSHRNQRPIQRVSSRTRASGGSRSICHATLMISGSRTK